MSNSQGRHPRTGKKIKRARVATEGQGRREHHHPGCQTAKVATQRQANKTRTNDEALKL